MHLIFACDKDSTETGAHIKKRENMYQIFHFLHRVFHKYTPSHYSVWRVDD